MIWVLLWVMIGMFNHMKFMQGLGRKFDWGDDLWFVSVVCYVLSPVLFAGAFIYEFIINPWDIMEDGDDNNESA